MRKLYSDRAVVAALSSSPAMMALSLAAVAAFSAACLAFFLSSRALAVSSVCSARIGRTVRGFSRRAPYLGSCQPIFLGSVSAMCQLATKTNKALDGDIPSST